jgi:hypothetical protein
MAPAMCRTMSTALVVGSPVNIGTNKSTYQLLSDEQKARFNAIAPADNRNAAAKDQHDLTKLCDEKTSGATDLPIDRIAPSHPFRNDRFPGGKSIKHGKDGATDRAIG